jgi:hypothetical protein
MMARIFLTHRPLRRAPAGRRGRTQFCRTFPLEDSRRVSDDLSEQQTFLHIAGEETYAQAPRDAFVQV